MLPEKPQDQYVKVGNINTRFWAAGSGGPSVILIHGLGACIETWLFNFSALAEHHRVYALDLVGFGRSDRRTAGLSPDSMARFVGEFMQVKQIEKASLVGNSMGGLVSLLVAIQSPEKVSKLVLVDAGGLGKEASMMLRLGSVPVIGELAMRPSRKGVVRTLRNCMYDPSLVTDEIVDMLYAVGAVVPGGEKCTLTALRAMCSIRGQRAEIVRSIADSMGKITVPTLIVWGNEDRVLPVAHGHAAARKIPNSVLQVFERAGHTPQMEQPEQFNKALLQFLV